VGGDGEESGGPGLFCLGRLWGRAVAKQSSFRCLIGLPSSTAGSPQQAVWSTSSRGLRGAKERGSCVGQGVAELGSEGLEVAGGFTGWRVAVATPPPAGMVGVCGITTKRTWSNSERTTTKPKPQNRIRNDQQARNHNQVHKEQSNQSR
jgi:hypothetical protein